MFSKPGSCFIYEDKPSTAQLPVNTKQLEHVRVEARGSWHALVLKSLTLTGGAVKELIQNIR